MELKYLDLFKCYWIFVDSGVLPPGGGGGWMGVCEGVGVWGGLPCMHACTYTCMHAHTHACMHAHMHVKHDKNGYLHVGGHLQFLYMYTCVCMHVHACTCMCTCVGTPPCPQTPTHPPVPPQSHREPKTPKFKESWTNQDISILFEDSLPLNTPELIYTIVGHPRYPPTHLPYPRAEEPKSEKLQ